MRQRVWARADERHLPEQDIDELRKLVDAGRAERPADSRHAGIVAGGLNDQVTILGNRHRAELEDPEHVVVPAIAPLAEENRAATVELDRQSDQQQQRRDEDETNRARK